MKINDIVKKIISFYTQASSSNSYTPAYRIVEISQNEHEDYTILVQVINKSTVFHMKPEEILADDKMVNHFAPTDVRTLTYLGYLGINAPKYKILAHRMAENSKVLFAISKKGEKQPLVKTAAEILQDKDVISSMKPTDAHTVGYNLAMEDMQNEKAQTEALKKLALEGQATATIPNA